MFYNIKCMNKFFKWLKGIDFIAGFLFLCSFTNIILSIIYSSIWILFAGLIYFGWAVYYAAAESYIKLLHRTVDLQRKRINRYHEELIKKDKKEEQLP